MIHFWNSVAFVAEHLSTLSGWLAKRSRGLTRCLTYASDWLDDVGAWADGADTWANLRRFHRRSS